METLEEEQHQSAPIFLGEVIEEILVRLPVKSILRRLVSKPWLSRISNPSFTKLHFTYSNAHHRTALFIYAYDYPNRKQHLLSATRDGGPVTQLLIIDDAKDGMTKAEHLNGLVFFTSVKLFYETYHTYGFIINPSTHKFFKLPDPYTGPIHYLFGFDESRNEHKVLMIMKLSNPTRFEIMIFCTSNYSWRKIDAGPPIGFTWDDLKFYYNLSVCVDSVIHLLFTNNFSFHILAFDLRTEMFSVINTPQVVVPDDIEYACIIKINGCIGVVFYNYIHVLETNKMHSWILQDYENRVWVKEIIKFTKPWEDLGCPIPEDSINMDEIIFCSSNTSEDVTRLVYNKNSGCFKSLQFTSGHQFPVSKTLQWNLGRCYIESLVPL